MHISIIYHFAYSIPGESLGGLKEEEKQTKGRFWILDVKILAPLCYEEVCSKLFETRSSEKNVALDTDNHLGL